MHKQLHQLELSARLQAGAYALLGIASHCLRLSLIDLYVCCLPRLLTLLELTRLGGAALVHVLRHACSSLDQATDADADQQQIAWQHVERFAAEAYERSWEKLHCGAWKSIASAWREAFAHAGVLRALCLQRKGALLECMKILDMVEAQLMTQVSASREALKLEENLRDGHEKRPAKKPRTTESAVEKYERPLAFPIRRLRFPSLDEFRQRVLLQNEPVIITGAMEHWPALGRANPNRAWRDLNYFRHVAGWRTVPIEIGSSYLEDDWKQELMTVNEFIDRYIEPPEDFSTDHERVVGYLAQHHLFDQIPVLGRDILTPDYCALSRSEDDNEDDNEDIAVNAWFGPQDTVSPLHFDPKDNLLCQAVGAKYLRLYAPSESEKLYPVDGLLSNTSQVQVHLPETHAQFPLFREAKYTECVLKEGEMLFIPPGHWHFVQSLSTSFSVSFWWS